MLVFVSNLHIKTIKYLRIIFTNQSRKKKTFLLKPPSFDSLSCTDYVERNQMLSLITTLVIADFSLKIQMENVCSQIILLSQSLLCIFAQTPLTCFLWCSVILFYVFCICTISKSGE
jgi:hypothetical protein